MQEFLALKIEALVKARFVILLLTYFAVCAFAQNPAHVGFDGKSWWEHVKVLAADDMEGRETGSPGLAKAAAYIVSQAQKDGLQPAGSDGFYQPVTLRSKQIDETQSSLTLVRNGQEEPLVLGEDAIFSTRVDLAPVIDAPLVFVGYGLQVPENQHDDFAGLDLKGKVAVVFSGSTSDISAALAAHYQSIAERKKALFAAGALGYISIPNPASMDIPWSRLTLARKRPSMALADAALDDAAGVKFVATFNPAHTQKLFEGSGHSFDEIAALGKDRKSLPTFPLTVSIKARAKIIVKEVNSANIVARYPGSDPKLKDQYVVLSAHMDHLGIGEPIHGDRIYNGAMDNGSGCALLLDLAAALSQQKIKTRRSILFVWVTAEEKGLLGSRYFAARPTVPAKTLVADINTDMFLPIFPLKLLTVYGLSESDLGDAVTQVSQKAGIAVQPDPEPLRNLFVRSDQYSFIREGVPSLAMKVGFEKGSPEEATEKKWLTERYHAPSDDLNQPVDLAAAGKFEDVVRDLTLDVANADGPPHWKSDSFFRRFEKTQ
jgi:Zn-dependent M28 family amino/carboxypeptidase